jgi:hypothetical protein
MSAHPHLDQILSSSPPDGWPQQLLDLYALWLNHLRRGPVVEPVDRLSDADGAVLDEAVRRRLIRFYHVDGARLVVIESNRSGGGR